MSKAKLNPVLLSLMVLVIFANVTWCRRGRGFNRLAGSENETPLNQAGRAAAAAQYPNQKTTIKPTTPSVYTPPATTPSVNKPPPTTPSVNKPPPTPPSVNKPPPTPPSVNKPPPTPPSVNKPPPTPPSVNKPPPTPPSVNIPPPPPPNGACNLTECTAVLGCRNYTICKSNVEPGTPIEPDRMIGTLETITCPKNSYPQEINVTTNVAGKIGLVACLSWEMINPVRKLEISTIPGCFPCQFKSKTPCTSQFKYINENGVESADWEECPDHLVIDVQRRSCVLPCVGTNRINQLCRDNGFCN